jgi:hypothetical protein
VLSAGAAERIGDIEFFGYEGLDLSRIRAALPVHQRDEYQVDTTPARVRDAVVKAYGKPPTDIAAICCDEKGNGVVFIGLPGASNKPFTYNAEPGGGQRLSPEIVSLYKELDAALQAAVRAGGKSAQEDDSNGYALINDPTTRSLQMRVHEWALKHEKEVLGVLQHSSSVQDRQIASEALGYAQESSAQINALVHASRDPDDGVRNNATRALAVLVRGKPAAADQIPPDTFIAMLNSGIWTDRNKGAAVVMELTRTRRPQFLQQIRTAALYSLIEMAAWKDHAYYSRLILGRIIGIPEGQLVQLVWKDPESIVTAGRKLLASDTANPPG